MRFFNEPEISDGTPSLKSLPEGKKYRKKTSVKFSARIGLKVSTKISVEIIRKFSARIGVKMIAKMSVIINVNIIIL